MTTQLSTPLICCVCNQAIRGRYCTNTWDKPFHPNHGTCASCHRPMAKQAKQTLCRRCQATRVDTIDVAVRRARAVVSLLGERCLDLPLGEIHFWLRHRPQPGTNYLGTAEAHYTSASTGALRSTINIKRGMPAIQFDYVVAHELTHVWFNIHDLHPSRKTNEGVAELNAYLILGVIGTPTAQVHQRLIATNTDSIYGGGFRRAHQAEKAHGWPTVCAHLLRTGRIPTR